MVKKKKLKNLNKDIGKNIIEEKPRTLGEMLEEFGKLLGKVWGGDD